MILESIRLALSALWANKTRAALTMLGISIGIAAVIAVVSIVQGLQYFLVGQIETLGANFIIIQPKLEQFQGPGMVTRQVKLTWEDGKALRDEIPDIAEITPQMFGNQVAKYLDRQHTMFVVGVNPEWAEMHDFAVESGRFFTNTDLAERHKVVVVGQKVADELRLGTDPIGKEIYLGALPVTVIGVMEEKGQSVFGDMDDFTFVPFDTALLIFGREAADQVQLRLRTASADNVEDVREEVARVLRRQHGLEEGDEDDFIIQLQDEIVDLFSSFLTSLTAVVGAIVAVSLIVAGVGIMNIMLVSVTERTREIGVRKAVGARSTDVMMQFLIEAVVLSLVGGTIGIAIGFGVGAAVVSLLPFNLPAAYVPIWAVAVAFGFCALVGIFFGIYPASKAARMDPIEALRYE